MNRGIKIIETRNISKTFPGVKALADINFNLHQGEVHCIVGENGAGKSTFIKILSGALKPDSGEIFVNGKGYHTLDPHTAQENGIQVIYQENILAPQMSVADNIFVGREKTGRFGLVDYKKTAAETDKVIDSLGIKLDARELVENLSMADQQFVKIIKAVVLESKVLIMDEPTTMFNASDIDSILNLVKELSNKGIGIIYISHNLKEITRIADQITVFRDGETVNSHDCRREEIEISQITREMVGRSVDLFYNKEKSQIGEIIFQVKDLKLDDSSPLINFSLRKGEILGISGMVGAGRTEIVRGIFGADSRVSGRFFQKGQEVQIESPADAIKIGIGFITEDRQKNGLALQQDIIRNITVASIFKFVGLIINLLKEKEEVKKFADKLRIKTPSLEQEVRFLSGGNQQKVVLARWLFADSDILIFDEPTRGIDVNAKAEIYKLMSRLSAEGKSIIMVSSDMPELIAMSDRVLVIRNGEITARISGEEINEENIISNALGVNEDEQTG